MDAQPRVQPHDLPLLLTPHAPSPGPRRARPGLPDARRAAAPRVRFGGAESPGDPASDGRPDGITAAAAGALALATVAAGPSAGSPAPSSAGSSAPSAAVGAGVAASGPVSATSAPAPAAAPGVATRPQAEAGDRVFPPAESPRDSAVTGTDTLPDDGSELARRLERLLADPALQRAHVGLKVAVAETGEVLFERAAEKRFTPASTVKLVTGAVALDRLGADFRWRTRLAGGGPVEDGTLEGDLWVVGGGDPGIGRSELESWASALRDAGVRRIEGDVVADGRSLARPLWGRGWMWDELHLGWATGVTALQLDEAGVQAWLLPGSEPGDPVSARVREPAVDLPLEVAVRTGPPGSRPRLVRRSDDAAPGSGRIEGWIPADADSLPLWMAPVHPTGELVERFGRVLRDAEIRVGGRLRRAREIEEPPAVGGPEDDGEFPATALVFRSDSLGGVLGDMLAPSDNQTAEILLRTLGREEGREGTPRAGLEVLGEVVSGWGVAPDALALADGSGLSRYDELTPAALVRVLRRVWRSPQHEVFLSALAAPGEDGTLESRLLDTAARERLRAKTGSLAAVRGLAGYVEAGDGTTLIFALLVNGYGVPGRVAEGVRDLLVEQLSLHGRPVEPGRAGIPRREADGDDDG